MTVMKKIGTAITNELQRPSLWDAGWRLFLLSGIATFAATLAIVLARELL